MKMAVFWVVAPYSLEEVYRRFRRVGCLHHQGDESDNFTDVSDTIEAASTSENSVNFCQDTWRKNPDDSHLH
jgi:hypothetical protein